MTKYQTNPASAGEGNRTTGALEAELAYRAGLGLAPTTVKDITSRLAEIGYELYQCQDYGARARYMSSARAGKTYPCITTGIRERDTGRSFAHFGARRDANFRKLQDMRRTGRIFAVLHSAILEI